MCHYLVGPFIQTSAFCFGSASPNHTGDRTRGRRAFPQSFELPTLSANTRQSGISASARGVPLQPRGWARDSKRSSKRGQFSFFVRAMPSSHTPSGSCRKTSSREKDLGARTEPRPTRKMSAFLTGFSSRAGLFVVVRVVVTNLWQQFLFLVCGKDRNRIG